MDGHFTLKLNKNIIYNIKDIISKLVLLSVKGVVMFNPLKKTNVDFFTV
jgi:hypothetical protein